jgi:hypothetical protein
MGKDNLKVIATELVTQVRKSVTIDWTLRESARAKIKVLVKRIEIDLCAPAHFDLSVFPSMSLAARAHSLLPSQLYLLCRSSRSLHSPQTRHGTSPSFGGHGYPPDLQDEATKLVLQQAELLCAEWAA